MKYVIFLGDGMADLPVPQLGQRTPLMAAVKPNMDRMASEGLAGMIKTVPEGMNPAATRQTAVMGYIRAAITPADHRRGDQHGGRDGARRCGLSLQPGHLVRRTGFRSAPERFSARTMLDYSADEIGSDEAARLIELVNEAFADEKMRFYPGKSYRHCLVWKKGEKAMTLTPPHDILTRVVRPYLLPARRGAAPYHDDTVGPFSARPSRQPARQQRRLRPPTPSGCGARAPAEPARPGAPVPSARICHLAVDLVRGLGICAGLDVVEVPAPTGNIHTNFAGKARAVIQELARGQDYVYVHVEAPMNADTGLRLTTRSVRSS
jgi:2,3-bisphosphoglycerate-independent phosphoglycerate mutase